MEASIRVNASNPDPEFVGISWYATAATACTTNGRMDARSRRSSILGKAAMTSSGACLHCRPGLGLCAPISGTWYTGIPPTATASGGSSLNYADNKDNVTPQIISSRPRIRWICQKKRRPQDTKTLYHIGYDSCYLVLINDIVKETYIDSSTLRSRGHHVHWA